MTIFDRFKLDGKTALVTGGSRGLGLEIAKAISDAGAKVIICGRSQSSLDEAMASFAGKERKVSAFKADFASPAAAESAFRQCLDTFGTVDILVNNLGGRGGATPLHEQSLEDWQAAMDLNLTTCFLGMREIGGAMIKAGRSGRIINISSMNAFVANRGIGGRSYEAAKAAVVQLTRAAAADWAPHGVNVNAICPGLFMTDANKSWSESNPDVIETLLSAIPMERAGRPEEIGPLAVFLASPAANYITGSTFMIDGGYTLW
ncbi:MAG: SDR family oxidoreductase [Rhizobiaceae bacterium]|nr:SDR family oxidoreductase [Rhizobiaceae bacterium]